MKKFWRSTTPIPEPAIRRNTTCIVAGDSHCLAYDGLDVEFSGGHATFKSAFCSSPEGLRAFNLATPGPDKGLALNPNLVSAIEVAANACSPDVAPLVLLTFGGVDAIVEMTNPDWQDFDIWLPEEPDLVDRDRNCLQYELFASWICRDFAHVAAGLQALEREIEGRLNVLSPPPPHRDNADLVKSYESRGIDAVFAAPLTRWKLARIINQKVAEVYADVDIQFIDTWSLTSSGRYLDQIYELDGFHGNKDYAWCCVERIVQNGRVVVR